LRHARGNVCDIVVARRRDVAGAWRQLPAHHQDLGRGRPRERRCRALLIERNLMIKPDELRALLMKTATSGSGT